MRVGEPSLSGPSCLWLPLPHLIQRSNLAFQEILSEGVTDHLWKGLGGSCHRCYLWPAPSHKPCLWDGSLQWKGSSLGGHKSRTRLKAVSLIASGRCHYGAWSELPAPYMLRPRPFPHPEGWREERGDGGGYSAPGGPSFSGEEWEGLSSYQQNVLWGPSCEEPKCRIHYFFFLTVLRRKRPQMLYMSPESSSYTTGTNSPMSRWIYFSLALRVHCWLESTVHGGLSGTPGDGGSVVM